MRPSDTDIGVATPNYRPPDVFLGDQRFQDELDMWSFGCLVVELYTRQPLFFLEFENRWPKGHPKDFVDAIRATVGLPGMEPKPYREPEGVSASLDVGAWLDTLPFFSKWYKQSGQAWITAETAKTGDGRGKWPVPGLEGCPRGMKSIAEECLLWHPRCRLTVAKAKQCLFLQSPGEQLRVRVSMMRGKNGTGTVAEGDLDPDLLRFLQRCPSWSTLAIKRHATKATVSKCVRAEEAAKDLKTEIPGIVDAANPPKCRSLNGDKDLKPLPSERLAAFVRALRKKWRPWLQQLGTKMREAVAADNMPEAISQKNGGPILQEDFADNAFAYASIQLMDPGERDDGWHTDGGCSLLHAAVTLFGTRDLEVKTDCLTGTSPPSTKSVQCTLEQKPGSFYVGNLSALEHNVRHHETDKCEHTFDLLQQDYDDVQRLLIAVMIRSDVFRDFRARKIDSTPGPKEFFHVVNYAVAEHLALVPVALPDLTEVLDELRLTSVVQGAEAGGLSD